MSTTAASTALMNRAYRHQRHIYNLTRKYYLLGRDRLIDQLNPEPGSGVLEVGCGTGRNLVVAADRFPAARFFGIDVSTEMLTSAITTIAKSGLSSRVTVAHADATRPAPLTLFGRDQFDRIFISYSLSMIPMWKSALDVAISRLAPRGELHIVDFGGQQKLPGWFRSSLRLWLAQFHVTPCDSLEYELRQRADGLHCSLTFERLYRDYSQYARLKLTT
jgi:S-adenosylmethionine-diacylgycerolhomoserine-N-methlytransferase